MCFRMHIDVFIMFKMLIDVFIMFRMLIDVFRMFIGLMGVARIFFLEGGFFYSPPGHKYVCAYVCVCVRVNCTIELVFLELVDRP